MFAFPLGKVGMRLLCLSMIALMTLAAPAFAGTEDGDTPTPFTAPSAGQTTTSGLANNGDSSAQPPPTAGGQSGDQQQPQGNEGKPSGSFYQEHKKDTDGH